MGFDKTKKLDFTYETLNSELNREKELLERYENEYVKSVRKPVGFSKPVGLNQVSKQLFF